MIIHIVEKGDTVFSLSQKYKVNIDNIMADNGLVQNYPLVIGQALVIQIPKITHTVSAGESIYSIANKYNLSVKQLFRNNIQLNGSSALKTGQELVISYDNPPKQKTFITNSYAYPNISPRLLNSQLPYLSYFTPFTYGITASSELVDLNDTALISAAESASTIPIMHLSTLTEDGNFSNSRASNIFNNPDREENLINLIIKTMQEKGYKGLDVDFEFIFPEEKYDYINFLQNLRLKLNPMGYPLFSALAPKTSDMQRGILYEGHDYSGIGSAVNGVLLMTYEWGYTYSAPMAVAPIESVRRVVEYAVTRVSRNKLFLGIPTYGYNWTLPYKVGNPGAPSLSPVDAISLAARYNATINYDTTAQAPWFNYTDDDGKLHEVWFEDPRSIKAKLKLTEDFGLIGLGYWNLMRDFPQNWIVLNSLYNINDNPNFL